MPALKKLIASALNGVGYVVLNTRRLGYAQDGLFTLHSDRFRHDDTFQRAYRRGIQANNGLDPKMEWRAHVALWACSIASRAPGDFIECGVNAGFISSAIMQSLDWRNAGRRFYLIDTFAGPVLSQYSQQEIERGRVQIAKTALAAGAYVTDIERVRANFSEWPNAVVVQGAVPDVLHTLDLAAVAFVHLDMNCALPERAALEFFWSRLSPGGVVLFDDYTYFGHNTQTEAIDAALRPLGVKILALPTGQGLIVK